MQDMDVGNGVGGSRVFDNQVINLLVLALVEANPKVRLGQCAEIVADFGVFCRHVDEHRTERQLFDELMLVRLQHTHEAEVLWRDLSVEVALQDGVRHLVAEDDESATAGTKETFCAALDVLDDAFVTFVKNNQHGVNPLKIRQFCCRFLSEELLQSTP